LADRKIIELWGVPGYRAVMRARDMRGMTDDA
jgi:hypothetical protein